MATGPFAAGGTHTFTLIARVNSNTAAGSKRQRHGDRRQRHCRLQRRQQLGERVETSSVTFRRRPGDRNSARPPSPPARTSLYTITLSNNGPSDAPNAVLTDTVPAGTTFVSFTTARRAGTTTTSRARRHGPVVRATKPDVVRGRRAAGVHPHRRHRRQTPAPPAGHQHGVRAQRRRRPPTRTTTTRRPPRPSTPRRRGGHQDRHARPVFAGANLTYTITLTNNGPNPAQNVSLTDATRPTPRSCRSLPRGVDPTPRRASAARHITSTRTSVASGAAPVFTLIVKVTFEYREQHDHHQHGIRDSTTPDPDGANNSSRRTTTVNTQADIAVLKNVAGDGPSPGRPISSRSRRPTTAPATPTSW